MSLTAEDHFYAGVDFFAEGKLELALAEYRRAVELRPSFPDALHGIAQACYASGDFPAAIAAARRLLEIDPGDVLAWTTLSRTFQRQGLIPEAEEAATKARILGWKKQLQDQKAAEQKP